MKVTLEYFAQAREAAGVVREVVETGPCSAAELVARVARDRGGRLASLLLGPDGRLSGGVLLVVGGRQVAAADGVELKDGDEVVVMPAVSGG